jgi:hypothetical protein
MIKLTELNAIGGNIKGVDMSQYMPDILPESSEEKKIKTK